MGGCRATPPRHRRTEENWPRVRAIRPATAEKEVPAPNPSMRIPGVAKRERRSRRVLVASECGGNRQAATPGRKSDSSIGLFHEGLEIGKVDAHALEERGPVGAKLR